MIASPDSSIGRCPNIRIKLGSERDMSVQKQKIGKVPTLILKPKAIKSACGGLL